MSAAETVVVAVAGGGRGSGKTVLISSLLKYFPGAGAIKLSRHFKKVTDSDGMVMKPGKDTRRLKESGAARVILAGGEGAGAKKILEKALDGMKDISLVFVEGAAGFDHPATRLRIFVEHGEAGGNKPGSGEVKARAHIVVSSGDLRAEKISLLVENMMGKKDRRIIDAVLKKTRGGTVSCAAARATAGKLRVTPARVGSLCTAAGIRIDDCVLGCFGKFKEQKKPAALALKGGLEARKKVWIEKQGMLVMGEGRARLLRAIQSEGSINRGAQKCGISYRRAWAMIHTMEERTGRKIVETSIGGRRGGGSRITPFGLSLLKRYEGLDSKVRRYVQAASQ